MVRFWKVGGYITPCVSLPFPKFTSSIQLKHHKDNYEGDKKNHARAPEGREGMILARAHHTSQSRAKMLHICQVPQDGPWGAGRGAVSSSPQACLLHTGHEPTCDLCKGAHTHPTPSSWQACMHQPTGPAASSPATHSPSSCRFPGTCAGGRPGTAAASSG